MALVRRSVAESAPQSLAGLLEDLRPERVSWQARHLLTASSMVDIQANRRQPQITASRMPRIAIWVGLTSG